MSTANVARDMNAVREAVGDKKMTYLGFSYGTFLGATLQSLFPGKTRAVVLDGALDPDQYINEPLDSLDEQNAGFERGISRFLSACANDPAGCGFGDGDPRGTLDDLIEQADASPIPASDAPGRPVDGDDIRAALVSGGVRQVPVGGARARRSHRPTVVTPAGSGRSPMGSTAASTTARTIPPRIGTSCSERSSRTTRAASSRTCVQARARTRTTTTRSGTTATPSSTGGCSRSARGTSTTGRSARRRRDPTTLVVGTRYDPATPYKGAKRMVQQLGNARLLTMTGDGHTAYGARLAVRRRGDRRVPHRPRAAARGHEVRSGPAAVPRRADAACAVGDDGRRAARHAPAAPAVSDRRHRRGASSRRGGRRYPWIGCPRRSSFPARRGPTATWAVTGGSSSATTTTTRSTTWRTRSRATSRASRSRRATRSPT